MSNNGKIADILHLDRSIKPAWANPALYRSAVKLEGLIYFLGVQAAVAQQLPRKHEDRYFVPVARPRGRLQIDIDDINGDALRRRQRGEFAQHFLA